MRIATASIAAVVAMSRLAQAQSVGPTRSYSAFDLQAGKITIGGIPDGAAIGPSVSSWHCNAKIIDSHLPSGITERVLTIERTDDPACIPIFAARQPPDLGIDLQLPPPPAPPVPPPRRHAKAAAVRPAPPAARPVIAFPVVFDHGLAALVRPEYTEQDGKLDFKATSVAGRIVYYSKAGSGWAPVAVDSGIAAVTSDDIADDTEIYFQPARRKEVFVVTRVIVKPPAPEVIDFDQQCHDVIHGLPPASWTTEIDAANAANELRVRRSTARIVEPNSFGLLVVRHAEHLQATFESSGTVQLTTPPLRDGTGQSGKILQPSVERVAAPPQGYVCAAYQVAPHAPGSFTVTVALDDPARTAPVSQRKIDIIVLQRFSGAFRAGIAGIYGAPDQKFEARTAPGSAQAEIVRTTRTPVELVLGYSIYFEGLGDRPGRSYFTHDGNAGQDGHGGFYLGFGAVSVSGTNSVDFLKSLYAGLEYEFSPYFAVAVTGVVRRVDELTANARVGGPAPMTIPTRSTYVAGAAIVLNISPSFFKFANGVGK